MTRAALYTLLAFLTSQAPLQATSLGEAAKRERERREKNKADGVEVKVISADDLAEVPSDGGKGTYNEGTNGAPARRPSESSSGATAANPSTEGSSADRSPLVLDSAPGRDKRSAAPPKPSAAMSDLISAYRNMASSAKSLIDNAKAYEGCDSGMVSGSTCTGVATTLTRLAKSLAHDLERAEQTAREGGVTPGEIRVAQSRCDCGVDFDHVARLVQKYRR
jgi:hypothetical protein